MQPEKERKINGGGAWKEEIKIHIFITIYICAHPHACKNDKEV